MPIVRKRIYLGTYVVIDFDHKVTNSSPLTRKMTSKRLYFNYFKDRLVHFNGTAMIMNIKLLYLLLSALLLLCLAPMPYGYYQLVRFISMVLFALFAYNYWMKDIKPLAITIGALALLFQPFIKIALGRAMWNVTDVVVALGLIGLYLYENNKAGN